MYWGKIAAFPFSHVSFKRNGYSQPGLDTKESAHAWRNRASFRPSATQIRQQDALIKTAELQSTLASTPAIRPDTPVFLCTTKHLHRCVEQPSREALAPRHWYSHHVKHHFRLLAPKAENKRPPQTQDQALKRRVPVTSRRRRWTEKAGQYPSVIQRLLWVPCNHTLASWTPSHTSFTQHPHTSHQCQSAWGNVHLLQYSYSFSPLCDNKPVIVGHNLHVRTF